MTKEPHMNACSACKGDGAHADCHGTGCANCDPATGNCPACAGTGNDLTHWRPARA